jgi:HAD superfamily hydrolase (TIGR01509 family)
LLDSLRAQGWKLAVLTGAGRHIGELLKHQGVDGYFVSIVHSERITRSKPDPEGLVLALKECGVSPEHAVLVGDRHFDIEAGKNGGVAATVGITHGFGTRTELKAAGADYIIDSLAELPAVIQKIEQMA